MKKKVSKKKVTKRSNPVKLPGSDKSRDQAVRMTKAVLKYAKGWTPTEAAEELGCNMNDVRNMRMGNNVSLPILVKLINKGHFTPESLLSGKGLERGGVAHARTSQVRIDSFIRKLARVTPGKEMAKLTGFSVTGAYGLRDYGDKRAHVTLYPVLELIRSGYSIDEVILGIKPE